MESLDLRIRNYVQKDGVVCQVLQINGVLHSDYEAFATVRLNNYGNTFDDNIFIAMLESIPITNEWLLKFGFVQEKNSNDFIITLRPEDTSLNLGENDDETGFYVLLCQKDEDGFTGHDTIQMFHDLKYVHELQNLYYTLTRKELEINQN